MYPESSRMGALFSDHVGMIMFACLHAPGNLELLVECAGHFSPLVEETSEGTVVLDIRGLGSIYGPPEQIAAAIERQAGIPVNVSIASNPDAAVHAARGFHGTTVIPSGEEAAVLAPLPLYLLGGSPEFARTLDLWGMRVFGDFAALPPLGIAARLGEEGAHLQQLARGAGRRQLRLRVDPLVFREEQELEYSVSLLEPLLFLLSGMVNTLCERLRFYGRATNGVRLDLKLERTAGYTAELLLPVPMLNSRVLLKLLQLELSGRSPQAPVEKIRLELKPVDPRVTQNGLFLPASPEPEKLEITLARIRALVGVDNVGAPEILNTHRADRFQMKALEETKKTPGETSLTYPKLAFRRFRPPCPARVWLTQQGRPAQVFSSRGGGNVVACAGPWKTSGDWWTNEPWDHQEWDVEIQNAGLSRIYEDCQAGQWFIMGDYD